MDTQSPEKRDTELAEPMVDACQSAITKGMTQPSQSLGLSRGREAALMSVIASNAGRRVGLTEHAEPMVLGNVTSEIPRPKLEAILRPTITRATPKKIVGTKVLDVIKRAFACCVTIPERMVCERTAMAYRKTFARMMAKPVLDPLAEFIARDTYHHRRASLHFGSRHLLLDLIAQCAAAAEQHEPATVQRLAGELHRALDRIEPALVLDPPCPAGASLWDMPPSRWTMLDKSRPRRRKQSKKHALKHLPKDWTERLWKEVGADWPHANPLAIHLLAPSRPADLVPGARPHGWSPGAQIRLVSPRLLEIIVAPVKTHGGKFGSPTATTNWDPIAEGGPAAYLAELCAAAGGRIIVSITSKDAMRKSLGRLGRRALPELKRVNVTPYVIRNQVIADLKATSGAGEETASAAGHCTDRTQSYYGRAEHGRKRKGFLGAKCARKPRTSNVARARALGMARWHPPTLDTAPEDVVVGPKI